MNNKACDVLSARLDLVFDIRVKLLDVVANRTYISVQLAQVVPDGQQYYRYVNVALGDDYLE